MEPSATKQTDTASISVLDEFKILWAEKFSDPIWTIAFQDELLKIDYQHMDQQQQFDALDYIFCKIDKRISK